MEKNTQKTKLKLSKPARVLIIGLIVILVPLGVFMGILIHAGLTSGKPVIGNRFDSDLDPTISSSMLSQVESAVKGISGVEDCDVQLTTAQVRVNVDARDDASSDSLASLVNTVYDAVKKIIPVETYFTSSNGKKMYDLAINVYNKIDAKDEGMIYYLLTKNATMSEPTTQLVSEAVNQDLANQLRNGGEEPKNDK